MSRPARTRPLSAKRSTRVMRATAAIDAPVVRRDDDRPAGPVPTAPLPAEVARQSQREMDRLRRMPSGSPEAAQVRAYLQWIWSLPWESQVSEEADLLAVEKMLAAEHLGLEKAKDRVVEYLAVRRLKPDLPGPALCLVGPPGTGKSSLGAIIAKALDRPFVRLTVSGSNGAAELVGEARTIPGAQPGKIVRALREAGARNPVIMIDGIDRLAGIGGLGVAETLLELLDRESSRQFTDHYLGLSIDLSHAILVLCANHLELVPDILGDRIEVIEVPGAEVEGDAEQTVGHLQGGRADRRTDLRASRGGVKQAKREGARGVDRRPIFAELALVSEPGSVGRSECRQRRGRERRRAVLAQA